MIFCGGRGGHCENSITVLLCQAVLALFVHLNCPDISVIYGLKYTPNGVSANVFGGETVSGLQT